MNAGGVYEIAVAERLESWWSAWFADMALTPARGSDGSGTILHGRLPDQAALFGLLGRMRDLNLTLLEVRRLDREK